MFIFFEFSYFFHHVCLPQYLHGVNVTRVDLLNQTNLEIRRKKEFLPVHH